MGRAETPGLGGAAREPRPASPRMRAQAHWSTATPRPPPGGMSRWEAVGRGNGRRREALPPAGPWGTEVSDGNARCAPSP